MPERRTGKLTPAEARACVLYCQGYNQSDAVRQAFQRVPTTEKALWEKASKLFSRPQVQERIKELLDASKPSDIMSIGQWQRQVVVDIDTARAADNHNAVMNGNRLLGQALGGLKDNVSMTVEQRSSDTDLVKSIVAGDKAATAALHKALGSKDTFDA